MSILPDIFQDPALVQRQDALNAQWLSLNNVKTGCDGLPDSAWLEFVNDYKAWQQFYDSGSNWSADSKKATDGWQLKAQEWSKRLPGYGCAGSLGVITTTDQFGNPTGRQDVYATGDQGIPGVKDPPPDEKGAIEKISDSVGGAVKAVGIFVALVVLLVVGGLIYILTRPTLHAAAAGRRQGAGRCWWPKFH